MGETTAISWTNHSFNPWIGCTKVSPACDHCYAEALRKRTGQDEWANDVRTVTGDPYWRNPVKWNAAAEREGVRHRVFCASLADVFEDRDELHGTRLRLWDLVEATPWLDWQLLTKRPENVYGLVMERWNLGVWPHNVWLGTTVEDQERADERIPALLATPAVVRFLSVEPMLGPVDLSRWLVGRPSPIGWVICGGESGPKHRPLNLDHARSLRDQCAAAGVPFPPARRGGCRPPSGYARQPA